mmetsp:Transcript_10039/g.32929  ORF Transcript_10039/g.32929 Transcript_10039/m.32929 type:complete len:701 (-) Transcript_10039:274-2376(-)
MLVTATALSAGLVLPRAASPSAGLVRPAHAATHRAAVVAEAAAVVASEVVTPSEFPAGNLRSLAEYDEMYARSVADPSAFWADIADSFHWERRFDEVVDANFDSTKGKVFSSWFSGGTTNLCYNALDRHVAAGKGDQVAFYHESNEEGEELPAWTYAQALAEVQRLANALRGAGVKKGDRVTLFMPMVPQLALAMLACARIGAVHTVVFGGFSAEALASRIEDAASRVVITADGVMRGKKLVGLYEIADKAAGLVRGLEVETQIVLQRLPPDVSGVSLKPGRDVWWGDATAAADPECEVEWVGAEDPLFILYTSGSTGKPKGVLHSTGGYMVYAATTTKYVFDLQPGDVYFCTADCGWITGHSYVTYGPLLNGASQLVFEGVPSYPDAGRLWRMVDKYTIAQLYTAPTAIRALMREGTGPLQGTSRSSLKLLGSVGEPINPEAWRWYYEEVGGSRCPVVDTWWQTETGGVMIVPLPIQGASMKPGCAMRPFFGVQPAVINEQGEEKEGACEGLLAIKAAWPSTIRDVFGDYERYQQTYFPIPGFYLTGDGCRRDEDGHYWITGRVDDVINVSGHRIGTAEVESAVVLHPNVAEAAVVGYPHPVKGEGIYIYVTLNEGVHESDELRKALVMQCRSEIGAFAAPDVVHWAPSLPKTRSGKIMRRILRKIAASGKEVTADELGDTSTLADPPVVDQLIASHGM